MCSFHIKGDAAQYLGTRQGMCIHNVGRTLIRENGETLQVQSVSLEKDSSNNLLFTCLPFLVLGEKGEHSAQHALRCPNFFDEEC